MKSTEIKSDVINSSRLRIQLLLIFLVLLFYLGKLFNIQIIQGAELAARALDNRTTTLSIPTDRGNIFDRNGFILARNVPSFNVIITPAELPLDPGATQEIYRQLSAMIGVPVNNGVINDETVRLFKPCDTNLGITQIVLIADSNAPYRPVQVKCNVSEIIALQIREHKNDWPGVGIEITSVRDYPTGELTSEIIGFLGPVPAVLEEYYTAQGFVPGRDKVGYAGVENSLQEILSGRNGERTVEVDVAGKEIRDLKAAIQPTPGYDVELTIDTRLQAAARAALIGEIDFWNQYLNRIQSSNGVVIAMNPKTGEILALVSYPNYENNRMARLIPGDYYEQLSNDPNRPLFNHAISAEHPPGSVYKMAAAIGALNEGVISPEQKIFDPGKITILQKFSENEAGTPRDFVCYLETGHGYLDFLHGVAQSCDVYFYKIGGGFKEEVPNGGLGIWRMDEYAKALGYGSETGIELPGESTGLVPDPTWKRINLGENWSTGDTYIATIGQGYVLSTPLQVLQSFAILANDGKHMKPTLVHRIMDQKGNVIQDFEPTLVRDITQTPVIEVLDENNIPTGEKKIVEPWVIDLVKQGMRLVVTEGTASATFEGMAIPTAGKTGTAEYCDNVAQSKNLCQPGNWPTHSWYVGYGPYDDPEIAVVAFVYNGGEGASVAAPIVRRVLEAYFELKAIDSAQNP